MKTDARVKYTQKVLKSAFLQLLDVKPLNKITVKEVCDVAQLNRATFYAHYSDVYDLLEHIEGELLFDFTQSLKYLDSFDVTKMITAIYDMIEKNIDLCKIVIFKNPDAAIIKKMIAIAHDQNIEYWRAHLKKATDDEREMLFICLANGLMNVVVDGYEKYDKKDLVKFVNTMVIKSVEPYL